jgi:hypothetical protein
MESEEITKLGREAFAREVAPARKDHKARPWSLIGFDTEYDSRTGELLSWQLATESWSLFTPVRGRSKDRQAMTPETLWAAAAPHAAGEQTVVLVTYFSLAELQHLPVFERATGIREFARGSIDCVFTTDTGTRLFVFDIARFFDRSGLKEAAKAFGLKKLSYNTKKITAADLQRPRFRRYAVNDARITCLIAQQLRAAYQGEGVDILRSATPAGSAAGVFRRRYLHEKLAPPPARVRGLALRCCWGGRAEAFARRRWDQLHEYDLESAYPSAAVSLGVMPREHDWRLLRRVEDADRWRGGFVRVLFKFPPGESYPCLPVSAGGVLLYPLAGESWCSLDEVRLARELHAELRLLDGFVFNDGTTALHDMMADMRRRRATAVGAQRIALKLSMNSLIGKLIQHRTRPGAADIEALAKSLGVPIRELAGLDMLELEALGLVPRFRIGGLWLPEWNGLITGRVRAQVSRLARELRAVYCATDAVWTVAPIARLPAGLALKREGAAVVARTRLGAIWPLHIVHHAWSNRKAAQAALANAGGPQQVRYKARRPLHFAEALRKEDRVGRFIEETRTGTLGWDGKRQLCRDGSSRPWITARAFLESRSSRT